MPVAAEEHEGLEPGAAPEPAQGQAAPSQSMLGQAAQNLGGGGLGAARVQKLFRQRLVQRSVASGATSAGGAAPAGEVNPGAAPAGGAAPAAATGAAPAGAATDAPAGASISTEGSAKVEGGTFFSGPDATLSTSVPAAASGGQKGPAAPDKTDAEYEASMGIKDAIDKKTMLPVAGVDGKTFTAVGCAGKKDGKVSFTFDRAFVGDYEYASAGKTVRGVHVSISAALSGCGEHTDVKLIQILRNFTKKEGAVVTADPTYAKRRERSGWSDDKAPSRGWRVDGLDSDTTPFYVSDELYGNHGSSTKAAKLRDTPGDWSTSRNVGKEFRTCAVSYAGGKGTVLACVDWGYYIDDAGAASFYPAVPTAYAGAVSELTDAADRWDKIAGNTKANLVK